MRPASGSVRLEIGDLVERINSVPALIVPRAGPVRERPGCAIRHAAITMESGPKS
jgi:hypothetical protein